MSEEQKLTGESAYPEKVRPVLRVKEAQFPINERRRLSDDTKDFVRGYVFACCRLLEAGEDSPVIRELLKDVGSLSGWIDDADYHILVKHGYVKDK